MNYFELYGLAVSFNPDQQVVKQQFYALSKKYHPDFFVNETQETQDEVLALSTANNKAFQMLKDQQQRLHYVLTLTGALEENENYQLPQDFLMEMMEVNEAIMELGFDADEDKISELKQQTQDIETALNLKLNELTSLYDAQADQQVLLEIKDLYYRQKYLSRIKVNLSKLGT